MACNFVLRWLNMTLYCRACSAVASSAYTENSANSRHSWVESSAVEAGSQKGTTQNNPKTVFTAAKGSLAHKQFRGQGLQTLTALAEGAEPQTACKL